MHTVHFFWKLGHMFTHHLLKNSYDVGMRRFKSFYGVSPFICKKIWELIENSVPSCKPIHLMWTLNFLKQYNSENSNHAIFGADEKTMRKYVWTVIEAISDLDVILFENRYQNGSLGQFAFASIDGVDFKIREPQPFDPKYYSHKFRSAGLRYEIALCIKTGQIVWAFGGFACGEFSDLKIARQSYIHQVEVGEMTFADRGYNDKYYFIRPDDSDKRVHKIVMSRHETINKRLRHFKVLYNTFRHDPSKHSICFYSVVNITALVIDHEQPLFPLFK